MDKFMTEILGKRLSDKSMLLTFLLFRLSSVFFVQTHFVADEYWQSLEVAHRHVFGYGYLTWEWRESAIRSSLYPSIFAVLFQILRVLGLDYRDILIVFPRILQAIITAYGDLYTVKLSEQLYMKDETAGLAASAWTFWTILTSWFMFYCGSKTIVNTLETALTAITLYHYQRTISNSSRSLLWFAFFASITFVIRPTSAILWAPLALSLLMEPQSDKTFYTFACVGSMTLLVSVICDRVFYKRWVFTVWNFFEFNVLSGSSGFYGTHSWHWYFTQGFPVIMTTHLVPFWLYILNIKPNINRNLKLIINMKCQPVLLIFWQLFVYSWIPHKEFRFIMPVLPLAFCVVGKYLSTIEKRNRSFNARDLFILMLTTNLCLSVFFGTFWNYGPLQAANQVAKELETKSTNASVLYLMPCHSLPLYSHLHVNVTTRFLTCEPNLKQVESYMDEASRFYQNKDLFLRDEIPELATYDVIVIYQALEKNMQDFFKANNYSLSRWVINFGEFDRRRGHYIAIYSKYRVLN